LGGCRAWLNRVLAPHVYCYTLRGASTLLTEVIPNVIRVDFPSHEAAAWAYDTLHATTNHLNSANNNNSSSSSSESNLDGSTANANGTTDADADAYDGPATAAAAAAAADTDTAMDDLDGVVNLTMPLPSPLPPVRLALQWAAVAERTIARRHAGGEAENHHHHHYQNQQIQQIQQQHQHEQQFDGNSGQEYAAPVAGPEWGRPAAEGVSGAEEQRKAAAAAAASAAAAGEGLLPPPTRRRGRPRKTATLVKQATATNKTTKNGRGYSTSSAAFLGFQYFQFEK
jgi:hypothetical protein